MPDRVVGVYLSIAITCCFWCWKWNMWAEWASFLSPLAADLFGGLIHPDEGGLFGDVLLLADGPGPVIPYAGYSTSCADFTRFCHLFSFIEKKNKSLFTIHGTVNKDISFHWFLIFQSTNRMWNVHSSASFNTPATFIRAYFFFFVQHSICPIAIGTVVILIESFLWYYLNIDKLISYGSFDSIFSY